MRNRLLFATLEAVQSEPVNLALQTALQEHLPLAASPQLAENSRLGFATDASTLRWASGFSISSNTLGLSASLYDGRVGPRSTGKERDSESGNDYFGARYYASTMGRMMSPDPSQLYFANPAYPQSLNLYSYGRNNPLVNTDPTGMDCVRDNGDRTATTNSGDCENKEHANQEHYIDCDGCTANATAASLDKPTGTLTLTDSTGKSVGPSIGDWAAPEGVSNSVTVNGNTGQAVVTGDFVGNLGIPMQELGQLPNGTLRNPNAPPSLPRLKGKDRGLCAFGAMTNEMMGGNSGPQDSSDTAPGKGGAVPIPFYTTTRGGKPVTRQMGVDEGNGAKAGAATEIGNWGLNALACFLNNLFR